MRLHQLMPLMFASTIFWIPSTVSAQDADEVRGQLERSASVNPQEKLSFTERAISEIQAAERSMSKALEQAEKDKEPIKIQCLTKKLSSTRALLEVSMGAQARMLEALEIGASDKADHEFRRIAVALSKERQFLAEAEACTGDSGKDSGQTQIEVIGEEVEVVDVTEPPTDPGGDVGIDPPDTSPFE